MPNPSGADYMRRQTMACRQLQRGGVLATSHNSWDETELVPPGDYARFKRSRISGSRTSAHSPVSSSAFTFLPESARSRIASVNSYSPRGDGCNLAVKSKMLGRKAY